MSLPSLQILHEDQEILVINKPSGLVVVPGHRHKDHRQTLAGWVWNYLGGSVTDVGMKGRFGLVHRMDKDTSGVMVVAKTQAAYEDLVYQFKNRLVKKEYLALVWGKVAGSSFEVNLPIGRNPKRPIKFTVLRGGKKAQTRFRVIKTFVSEMSRGDSTGQTLLKAFPVTGRTHQIRVHLKSLSHPIVGDPVYSSKKQYQLAQEYLRLARTFLHACKLEFLHPASEEKVSFEAPLPPDLQQVLHLLT